LEAFRDSEQRVDQLQEPSLKQVYSLQNHQHNDQFPSFSQLSSLDHRRHLQSCPISPVDSRGFHQNTQDSGDEERHFHQMHEKHHINPEKINAMDARSNRERETDSFRIVSRFLPRSLPFSSGTIDPLQAPPSPPISSFSIPSNNRCDQPSNGPLQQSFQTEYHPPESMTFSAPYFSPFNSFQAPESQSQHRSQSTFPLRSHLQSGSPSFLPPQKPQRDPHSVSYPTTVIIDDADPQRSLSEDHRGSSSGPPQGLILLPLPPLIALRKSANRESLERCVRDNHRLNPNPEQSLNFL